MSTGDARRSQSAISFSFTKNMVKIQPVNHQLNAPTKRPREDQEETMPTINVNKASTATITEESFNRN